VSRRDTDWDSRGWSGELADQDSDPELDTDTQPDTDAPRRSRLPLLLVVLAVVLAAVGGWCMLRADALRGDATARNVALVDNRTGKVIADVSDAVDQIFTYSYQNVAATEQAAKAALTGNAITQYQSLVGQLRQQAVQQKQNLTTQVVDAGVNRLDGDQAQLLLFVDRSATRDGRKQAPTSAELSISAQLVNGHWLIADIKFP
jgi:Mce-associated membrane protein